ncbi:MAG TPA: porin [Sphingobium sp.]|nr:porin [Sphingobium sp.]
MKHLTLASAAILALVPVVPVQAFAQDQDSPIDSLLPADNAPAAEAPKPTGDPVLDRLNALEARIRQLESRNAELEQQAAQTQTRVENVEVRAAKAAQPGVVPTYSDVNGDFTFKPRGVLQVDYAGYNEREGGYDFSNGTDIRRGRFGFEGTAFKKFKWRLDAEFVQQRVNLLDAYISYALSPKWTVTAGQHKAPYGLEANTSDANNTFLERSMASNAFGAVGAERRVGLSFAYNTDKLNATVGLFGAGEAITRNATSRDEPYGVNGRITWDPILDTGRVVHLGVSGYHVTNLAANGVTVADRPNVRVDGGNLVSVAITGSAPQGGAETGVQTATYAGAEAAIVFGPFSVQGEYGALALNRYGLDSTLNFSGFNVFGSVFLTGESRSFKGGNVDKLKPFNDFNPGNGHWGAFELAVRYDQLDLDDPTLGLPATQGGRQAHTWTGALNWYLNPNLRAAFNYVRFTGRNSPLVASGVGTAKGDIFATRLQLDF